ncbi:hypothetical protein [Methylobacterium durans]|uniref:Uncharacterized protein n=1 Tax=Methylobacterium durans TaxID=2202825 RepID=A0A2U8WBP3_9HYPH|nr:hypothetical protein [Methylobacterium durans]AWN42712.1 hypothetical protein DK389_22150 [Methylobacterium durans]
MLPESGLGEVSSGFDTELRLVVYGPPATGLPWLVVCLGPDNEAIEANACASLEAAERMLAQTAHQLMERFENAGEGCLLALKTDWSS